MKTSITLTLRAFPVIVENTETQEVKCTCTSVMVTYDLSKHESKPLTEEWIEAICKYEGRDLRKKS